MRSGFSLCSIGSKYSASHIKPRSNSLAGSLYLFCVCTNLLEMWNNNANKLCCCYVKPCNPAVGGPAKSQLVHEVDALGGDIGKVADR